MLVLSGDRLAEFRSFGGLRLGGLLGFRDFKV